MKQNAEYVIIEREDEIYLTNINNGDIYQINDVVKSIIELCCEYDNVNDLASAIYKLYETESDEYSLSELSEFIEVLISNKVISL